MTTTPHPDSGEASAATTVSTVAVAVLTVAGEDPVATLEAIGRQVYGVTSTALVGVTATRAETGDLPRYATLGDLAAGLGQDVDYVWVLHGDAVPRPDALGALVGELERNEASLVGSKVLDAEDAERLESVGAATDVYGEPYSGLDEGEVDLEQYDVVRDVAFVSAVSMLVRRDLLRGLGGLDDSLPPVAAGLDFSQRARLAGGRVMVVPSSEVLHTRTCSEDVQSWREQAGRMRAMFKAYRLVTLAWVVPIGFLIYVIDGLLRLFLRETRMLPGFFAAVGWNLAHLPSTLTARGRLGPLRSVRDEELFRFQVQGSVRIRDLVDRLDARLTSAFSQEGEGLVSGLTERTTRHGRAATVAAALAIVYSALAARGLWFGRLPVVGFSLPLPVSPSAALRAFAGGWNPAELGAPGGVHPMVALGALAEVITAHWSGAQALLTAVTMLFGLFGTSRLLARLGVGGGARYAAGVVLLFGPFTAAAARGGYWPGLIAIGMVPWVVDAAVRPWPKGARRRLGRVSALIFPSAILAAAAPVAVLVPLVAVVLGVLAAGRRWTALLRAPLAVAGGAGAIAAYLISATPDRLLGRGGVTLPVPSWPVAGIVIGVAIVVALLGTDPSSRLAAWGGAGVALGQVVARFPQLGTEAALAGLLLGAFGSALVVGGALTVDREAGGFRRVGQALGGLAGVVVLALTVTVVGGGRAGMPRGSWDEALGFVTSLAPATGPDRVLLVGDPGSLPGESRTGSGVAYRLVAGSVPTLDQGWLPPSRLGDAALDQALAEVASGRSLRPGRVLAAFGVRWLVVAGSSPLTDALATQIDLKPLPLAPDLSVFENLSAVPRADPADGSAWVWSDGTASGPVTTARVRLSENADPRWGPDWSQSGWANEVSGRLGFAPYRADPLGRAAALAGGALVLLAAVGAAWGREPPR